MRTVFLRLIIVYSIIGAAVHFTAANSDCRSKHDRAVKYLQRIGISLKTQMTEAYGCSTNPDGCVSLDNIRCNTLNGLASFKQASGCPAVVIVGGTEQGKVGSAGHTLRIGNTPCISAFVRSNFYPKGAAYVDGSGNRYTPLTTAGHWDVYYL